KTLIGSLANKEDAHEDKHIFVKSSLQKIKVRLADINWVEALGDYVRLLTDDANIIVLSSMKSFSEKLPENQFLRIHKSYIINLEKVEKFTSTSVELRGKKLPLSRKRKVELREALGAA
ncbi:MAG: LytR/AlgR family response regulator transcription factor, partial [Aurantibacter sp.]